MAADLRFASAFEFAPHALRESTKRVGRPFSSRSGPRMLPMRAKKDARRGLSPLFTGRFKSLPGLARSQLQSYFFRL